MQAERPVAYRPPGAGRVRVRAVEVLLDSWYAVHRYTVEVRGRDGTDRRLARLVCGRGDRVAVLPYRGSTGTVLLVRQLRVPALVAGHAGGFVLEAPGGLRDGRSPVEAAGAELAEETGYRAAELEPAGETLLHPALVAERLHLFVTDLDRADRTGPGGGRADEEDVEVVELPLAEARALVRSGGVVDAKTVLLIHHLLLAGGGSRSPGGSR